MGNDPDRLLQSSLPIDRVAARVTRPAKPEDIWRPMPKLIPHHVSSGTVLATAPIPIGGLRSKPELATLPGRRRGRMVILGYAADQGSKDKNAKWVARCDCGNYEHRTRIFRWLSIDAPDMCRECQNRTYLLKGEWRDREPATRNTLET